MVKVFYSPQFERCSIGGLTGITKEILAARERTVFDWCREEMPIAFVLAGGYLGSRLDEESLVALHRLTLLAAATSELAWRRGLPSSDRGKRKIIELGGKSPVG